MPFGSRALAALLLAAAPLALPADADGGGWSVTPSAGGGSRPAEDGRPYFYLEGAPGAVLEDRVAVTNPGDEPHTVRLRGARDAGAWIRLKDDKVTVPPRTRAEVPFTVTVPEGAVPGDHPASLVVREDGSGRGADVRVHLRVSGPTLAALTVEDVRVDGGHISYALVNRGNTALTPKLAVRADGLLGRRLLDRAPRTLPVELAPGRRITLREPWPDVPALDSADVHLTVTGAGGARDEAEVSVRFASGDAVAAVGGGLLALVGGAYWGVREWGRRRRGGADEVRGART
ncbi:COG1470 family protein [Streptomyces sp. NPDC002851]